MFFPMDAELQLQSGGNWEDIKGELASPLEFLD